MNNFPNIWTGAPELSVKGPVLRSFQFNERFGTYMHVFECQVANKATLPSTQFGAIAEIVNERDRNKAWLRAWVAPGFFDDPSAPAFTERSSKLTDINEFICGATETKQIVATGTAADTGATVWESTVRDIDGVHAEKTTITIDTLSTVQLGEYDEVLGQDITIQRVLVDKTTAEAHAQFPSGAVLVSGTTHHYITFQKVKCNWYMKQTEVLDSSVSITWGTTENSFFPAVFESWNTQPIDAIDPVTGESYTVTTLLDVRVKEAYNGPCKVSISRGWSLTAPAAVTPTTFLPKAFRYDGIFFDINQSSCLHGSLLFSELVGTNHPVLDGGQVRIKNYPATNKTDWENKTEQRGSRPYKGGFVSEIATIYVPNT